MLQHGNPHAIPWGTPSSGTAAAAANTTTSPSLHAMRQHYAQQPQQQQQQPPLQPPPPLGADTMAATSSAAASADEHHRRISEVQACAEAARAMIGFCLRTFKDHKHGKAPMDLVNLQSLLGAADAGMGELHEKIQTLYTLVPRGGGPPQASSQQPHPQDISLDDIKAQVATEAAQLAATAAMIRSERSGRPTAAGPSSSTPDLAAAAAASLYNPASKAAAAPVADENRYVDTNVHHTQHQAPAPAHKQTWADTAAPRLQQQQQQGTLSPAEPILQPSATTAAAAPAPAPFEEPNPDEDVFHSMIGRLERQYQNVKGAGDQTQQQPQPHQQPSRPHYTLSPNTSGVSSAGAAAAAAAAPPAADSSFDSSFARASPAADEPHPQPAWHAALQHQQHYPQQQQQQQPYVPPSVPVNPSSSQVSHSGAASASGESVADWMCGGAPHTPAKPLATTPSRMVTTPPEALATPPSRGVGPYGAVASYAGSGAARGRAPHQEATPQQQQQQQQQQTPTPSRPRRQGLSPSPGRHNNNNTGGKQTSQTRTSSAGMHWKSSGERDGPKTFVLRFDDDAGTDCDDARPAGGGVAARGRGGEQQQHHQRGRSGHMSNTASSSSRVVSPNSRPSPSHRRPSPAKKGWR